MSTPNRPVTFQKLLWLVVFLYSSVGFSQTVSVDNSQSAPALVDILLDDACANVSNISSSSMQATGSFSNNGGAFPIADGVIIRTGNAGSTSGSYTGNNLDSQLNTNSDPYLQDLLDRSGRSAIVAETAFLEFDFVPISNVLSFDFLLASNEYGVEQCNSSDVLAFVLTDLQTGTETNLAVIPGSNTPITVQSIKDNTYNPVCPSVNAELFSSYEVDNVNSTINMRGYSSVLTAASSALVPGRAYKMRIVIGDANDSRFDSAIFISAGSFNTGVNLGADFSLCNGDTRVLDAGFNDPGYTFAWFLDNTIIANETNSTLAITEAGTYKVEATRTNSTCLLDDELVVENPMVTQPGDLDACYNPSGTSSFNLGENNLVALGLDPDEFALVYYRSQQDIANNNPIPNNQVSTYPGTDGETIFIKLRNSITNNLCDAQFEFNLSVSEEIAVTPPSNLPICVLPGLASEVDLSTSLPTFGTGLNPADFEVTYYNSQADAQEASDSIDITLPFTVPANTATDEIWLRIAYVNQMKCFVVTSFQIIVGELPPVAKMQDVVVCGSYILPALANGEGNYYTQADGGGTQLDAGDVINGDFTQTIYIYNVSASGCPSEPSSFDVTIVDLFDNQDLSGLEGCAGDYRLPILPEDAGAFYTAQNGGGRMFDPGATLNRSQTIYYYAEIGGAVCIDKPFNITINPLPTISDPADVIVCSFYKLPPLVNGRYDTQADGQGAALVAGDDITTTQKLYVYDQDVQTNCDDSNEFLVFIAPDQQFFIDSDRDVCGEYNLPQLEKGAYYSQPNGQGVPLPMNESLSEGQYTIYYFVETTSGVNCTANLPFDVLVRPIPPVNQLDDVVRCLSDGPFILQPTTNGEYFTQPDRGGTQLFPGGEISTSQTIYINNVVNGCQSLPSEFEVEIRPLPPIDNFVTINSCAAYELPLLNNGTYYTAAGGPNGTGETVDAGTMIDTNTTLWIYNAYVDLAGCFQEKSFEINILGVEVGTFSDVPACDAYTLPVLPLDGNYFTAARGRGMQLQAGDVIRQTQEIFVYARNGTRLICESDPFDLSFTVTISETPVIPPVNDQEACGSYTLPTLDQTDFDFAYYRAPNGQDPIAASEYTLDRPGTYTIYRYATAKNNKVCFDEDLIQVTIYPLLDFSVVGGTVCTNAVTGEVVQSFTLESGLDPAEFEVSWSLNNEVVHVGATHDAMAAGTYTVSTVKINPEMGADCNYNPTTVEVLASSQPNIEAEVSQPFADVSVITVKVVNGDGDYEYQVDGGEFQTSNEFYDVQSGTHEISARGITGNCDATTITVNVINYPKFFTPNADGFNDVWNIDSLQDYQDAQIVIFDRYGKLLKTIFPDGNGWDGTFRGENMPSDDYWFKVNFVDEKGMPVEFRAHFTLKR